MATSDPRPPDIEPDTKDWTWVLGEACPECGFDSRTFLREEVGAMLREVAAEWHEALTGDSDIHRRSRPDHWSILEYGGHVRDVFDLFEKRIRQMLKKRKAPTFRDWDQEAAAERYAAEEPAKVAYALASNAGKVADLLDRVGGDEWDRRGTRSDGAEFTVESISRYLLHDVEHHLWDAHRILSLIHI